MNFTRKELTGIQVRAEKESYKDIHPIWKRAYFCLAEAANCLDAMMARGEERPVPEED